jgi:O-antigen/teichoic acid export membrane protein
VGMLGIGIGLATPISLVSNAFQKAWMPFFMSYTNKISEAKDVLGRVLLYYVCGFGALLLVICAAAKPAVMLLTTSRFTDAYYIVGLTAAGQFLSGVFSILLPPLYFSKEVTRTSVIHGISAVVAILFGLIIIPSFGLIGAGITQMVGFLAMCILIHIWNRSQGNIYLQINYPWRRILLYPPIYFIYLLITLWPRNIGLPLEILFSLSLIIPIPALFFIMLSGYERKRGLHLGRQFLKRLGILNFSNISEPVASN